VEVGRRIQAGCPGIPAVSIVSARTVSRENHLDRSFIARRYIDKRESDVSLDRTHKCFASYALL
jgi:hypothetical protein